MTTPSFSIPQAVGWNTWNSRSVLSHVRMPEGFAVNLGLKTYQDGRVLTEALIGRDGKYSERVRPGIRSFDESYTELTLEFGTTKLLVQSMVQKDELRLLVTPKSDPQPPSVLLVQGALLWNRPGWVCRRQDDCLEGILPNRKISVYVDGIPIREDNAGLVSPYLSFRLDRPVAVSTGQRVSVEELQRDLATAKAALLSEAARFKNLSEAYLAMSSCLCWDTIFEPEKQQMCSPVSRVWSLGWGGYVLFCWDTYFSAMLSLPVSRELAYANLIAITREKTENGFIPNFGAANDYKTRDRSQPPVGSLALREVYRRFGDPSIVRELFDDLLEWNRWFAGHRMLENGQLCWGSCPYTPLAGRHWESDGVNERFGAALESGMDNSPMYDDIPFDPDTHLLSLADVGLTGLYLMDCEILAELAGLLGREADRTELRKRAAHVKDGMDGLWCEEVGMFLNRRTDTGEFSRRISPTNFYALFSDRISPAQLARILEHFYDPQEFGGESILPSISRSDPTYPEQDYWRGRIWAPLNFLVYLALRKQGCAAECSVLAKKSVALLLREWESHGHVHENYGGDSGLGCDSSSSDPFYHWGGLLALIALYDADTFGNPNAPLA